jgi:hypothetical protein
MIHGEYDIKSARPRAKFVVRRPATVSVVRTILADRAIRVTVS